MGSMSKANEAAAAAFAEEFAAALAPTYGEVRTMVADLGCHVVLRFEREGREIVLRVQLPTKMRADGYVEVVV